MPAEIAIIGGGPSGLALAALLETKGVRDYVVFERSDRETTPRGSCLDLHPGSGQKVFREIGAMDQLKKLGRWGGATVHTVANMNLEPQVKFGEGRDAPEVDRSDIRAMLLSRIPGDKMKYRAGITKVERNSDGAIVLHFVDGTTQSGFKLVVGADGPWSLTRSLVTTAQPVYTGHMDVTTIIRPSNPYHSRAVELLTDGSMAICGLGHVIWCAPTRDGTQRMELIFEAPENFPENVPGYDPSDNDACKKYYLQDDLFGTFCPEVRELIMKSEGDWRLWRLYQMPAEAVEWPCQGDVTLIGDAAHAATPWVGDGVNCAMRDSIILSDRLKEMGVTKEAVAAYEKEMFPFGQDLLRRCESSAPMFLSKDNPNSMLEFVKTTNLDEVIGVTDYI